MTRELTKEQAEKFRDDVKACQRNGSDYMGHTLPNAVKASWRASLGVTIQQDYSDLWERHHNLERFCEAYGIAS